MIYQYIRKSSINVNEYHFSNKEKRYIKIQLSNILVKEKDLLIFLNDFYSRKDAAFFLHLKTGKITALFIYHVREINEKQII